MLRSIDRLLTLCCASAVFLTSGSIPTSVRAADRPAVQVIPRTVFIAAATVDDSANDSPTAARKSEEKNRKGAKSNRQKTSRKQQTGKKRRRKMKKNSRQQSSTTPEQKRLPQIIPQPVRTPSYMQVRNSIPFLRSEYEANPSYRHDAAMELLLGQLRPSIHYSVPQERAGVALPFGFPQDRMYLPFIVPDFRTRPLPR